MHAIAERDELFKMSHEFKADFDGAMARRDEEERKVRSELQYRMDENRSLGEELGQLRKKEQSFIIQIK